MFDRSHLGNTNSTTSSYCNMDWIVLASLAPYNLRALLISYDVACQWKINFLERMAQVPKDLHIPADVKIAYGIPKCHV